MSHGVMDVRNGFKFYAMWNNRRMYEASIEGLTLGACVDQLRRTPDYYRVDYITDEFLNAGGRLFKNVEPLRTAIYFVGSVYREAEIDILMEESFPAPSEDAFLDAQGRPVSRGRKKALINQKKQAHDSRRHLANRLREAMSVIGTDYFLIARNMSVFPVKSGDCAYVVCPETFHVVPAPWGPVIPTALNNDHYTKVPLVSAATAAAAFRPKALNFDESKFWATGIRQDLFPNAGENPLGASAPLRGKFRIIDGGLASRLTPPVRS